LYLLHLREGGKYSISNEAKRCMVLYAAHCYGAVEPLLPQVAVI
jgi:hypothetical protein